MTKLKESWGLTDEQANESGTVRTLLVSKVHHAYTTACDQLSMRGYLSQEQRKTITDAFGAALKVLNEKIDPEVASISVEMDDLSEIAVKEMKPLQLTVDTPTKLLTTKEGDRYRWTMITGSAFEDRDGEIISTKAFEDDCDQMEETGAYGELLWWHCDGTQHSNDKEARPYLPLGSCDTSFVYEKLNYESGLYYDDAVGAAFDEKAAEFGASKSFYHKEDEPDEDGVYTFIRTKERSILPRTKEANLLTRLFGHKEKEMATNKERIAALTEKLGAEKAAELLQLGTEMSEKAEKFLASKEKNEVDLETASKEIRFATTLKELATADKELADIFLTQTKELNIALPAYRNQIRLRTKEISALKENVSELQGMVAALMGIQPRSAGFKASEKGRQPELTAEQEKLAADAEKSFRSPDVVDWLIKGTSLDAA